MEGQRQWRSGLVAILALTVGLGFPLGFLATYPSEEAAGFAGVIDLALVVFSLPISAWMLVVAVTLSMKLAWARWFAAFSFYMGGALAARQLVVGDPRDSEFLVFLALILIVSAVALGLLLLPSTAGEFRHEKRPLV